MNKSDRNNIINLKSEKDISAVFVFVRKIFFKTMPVFLIFALNWFGLFSMLNVSAFFNDTEGNQKSSVSVGTLDFSLESDNDFSPEIVPNVNSEREIRIVNDSNSMDFNYDIAIDFVNGANALCQILDLEVWRDNLLLSSSSLMNFSLNNLYLATSTFDNLKFIAVLNSNDYSYWSEICEFNFVFDGRQTDGKGFSDSETISNTIMSGTWENFADHLVINKVYYDVDSEHGVEKRNEWIELFNPTDEDINIKKWKICNHNKCVRINASTTIEAGAYILVSHDASTWKYWEVPDDVQTINALGGKFEMDNNADMLILKDKQKNIIDQMNWGVPDENWKNYNIDLWNPAIPDALEGHMLGRVLSGYDTDMVSDWEDLSLPKVEVLIPNGGEVWWVGHTEEIFWKASSTNESADSELSISLYYSSNSGYTWGFIGTTTNSGYYSFRVPLFLEDFTYYVPSSRARIKVVATGPENFMVQGEDESDEDFCPPIDYDLLTEEELLALKNLGLYSETSGNSSVSGGLLDLSIDLANENEKDDLDLDDDNVAEENLNEEGEITDEIEKENDELNEDVEAVESGEGDENLGEDDDIINDEEISEEEEVKLDEDTEVVENEEGPSDAEALEDRDENLGEEEVIEEESSYAEASEDRDENNGDEFVEEDKESTPISRETEQAEEESSYVEDSPDAEAVEGRFSDAEVMEGGDENENGDEEDAEDEVVEEEIINPVDDIPTSSDDNMNGNSITFGTSLRQE